MQVNEKEEESANRYHDCALFVYVVFVCVVCPRGNSVRVGWGLLMSDDWGTECSLVWNMLGGGYEREMEKGCHMITG